MEFEKEETDKFLKLLSVQQLRDLAFELYDRGEDISDLVEMIHERDFEEIKARELCSI